MTNFSSLTKLLLFEILIYVLFVRTKDHILYPDLGSDGSSVLNFCARSDVAKCLLFSQGHKCRTDHSTASSETHQAGKSIFFNFTNVTTANLYYAASAENTK